MSKIIKVIGTITFAAVMYGIPIAIACSFFLGWYGFIKLLLVTVGFAQYLCLAAIVYAKVEVQE